MTTDSTFFDITLHKMICSKGDFSSLYEISHAHGQISATFKRVNHHRRGTEIFIKHLHANVLLQEILDFVFPMGQVYQIRILLEFSGHCRGYCYVNFFEVESARKAMMVLCGMKIRNSPVVVKMSFDNNRLEISNISKQHTAEEVFKEVSKVIGNGLQEIFFLNPKDMENDHSNCILIYDTHKNALEARKQVFKGFELFGEPARIDWAIPEEKLKSKRLYFDVALPKLTKPELYEEMIKIIKPKHILNIFLQRGVGYITFQNESVAYDSFKLLKNMKLFGMYLKLSFSKFYQSLPNTSAKSPVSEMSDYSDNQIIDEPTSQSYTSIQHESTESSETSGCSSFSSNESSIMTTQVSQNPLMVQNVSDAPVVSFHQEMPQLQNSHSVNYGMAASVPEIYRICGVPYPSPCDCWVSQYSRQNQYVEQPIRIVQLNSNIHNNMPLNFFQMTQDFYRQFHHQFI